MAQIAHVAEETRMIQTPASDRLTPSATIRPAAVTIRQDAKSVVKGG
ncbi:hypothetical protein U5A82_08150 [Sphingobium sp. CR2-8]|nr:hypothetical protein [Sphingobium sp. CR2-8]MEC3910452.1 hypothetical protein [Sphingobium sp. CR2-8]